MHIIKCFKYLRSNSSQCIHRRRPIPNLIQYSYMTLIRTNSLYNICWTCDQWASFLIWSEICAERWCNLKFRNYCFTHSTLVVTVQMCKSSGQIPCAPGYNSYITRVETHQLLPTFPVCDWTCSSFEYLNSVYKTVFGCVTCLRILFWRKSTMLYQCIPDYFRHFLLWEGVFQIQICVSFVNIKFTISFCWLNSNIASCDTL